MKTAHPALERDADAPIRAGSANVSDTRAPRRQAPSIRGRLLRLLLPLLVVLLVTSSVLDYHRAIVPVEAAYDAALGNAAFAISAHLRTGPDTIELDLSEQSVALLRSDMLDRVFFRVIGPTGATLSGDPDLSGPQFPVGPTFYSSTFRGEDVRGVAYPVATPIGISVVLVAETTGKRAKARRELITSRLVQDVAIVLFALIIVWVSVGGGLKPLEDLAAQLRARLAGDLKPLPEEGAPREVLPLIEALNRLFGRIGATQDSQRRFVENAAHQLRTPLAGLKGQVDLAIRQANCVAAADAADSPPADRARSPADADAAGVPADPGARAGAGLALALSERLGRIREATTRITHLANQLLTLSRSDRPSHDTASRKLVSLPDLVADAVATQIDRALARGQDLGAETEPATLRAVEWELRELLSNLIDNAIRYTPNGGHITVRCAALGERVHLEVEDTGQGIPAGERDRVFERFYRVTSSTAGGSGLGLAIVHEIADHYDASVEIRDPGQGIGTVVRVSFPSDVRPDSPSAAAGT